MFHIPERIHKRPFIVACIVLGAVLLASAGLIAVLDIFGATSDLPVVSVKAAPEGNAVSGIGINIPYIPTSNLVVNPSFEDVKYDQIYTVSGATTNSVFVLPDKVSDTYYADHFFVGGKIRIMSLDENGEMITKLVSDVTGFEMNQLGLWNTLAVPEDTREGQSILALSSSPALSVGVGSKGLLISGVTSAQPVVIDTGLTEDFVGITYIDDRFYAATANGSFLISTDGKAWNTFSSDSADPVLIQTVSAIGKIGLAAGENGAVLMCSDGIVSRVDSRTSETLHTSAGNGSEVLFAGENGALVTTSNGILFRVLSREEMPVDYESADWVSADYLNDVFVLGGSNGELAVGSYSAADGKFSLVSRTARDPSGTLLAIKKIMLLPSGEMIILDSSGSLFCSNTDTDEWKQLSALSDNLIEAMGSSDGKIILSQGISSQTTQLFTCIRFADVQSENTFRDGDMCYIAASSTSVPSVSAASSDPAAITETQAVTALPSEAVSCWQAFGEQTMIETQDKAPSGGGVSSLHLIGKTADQVKQPHYISQVIAAKGETPFQAGSIYQINVWLKQNGIANGEVMAWISGNFTSAGTTFTDVGNGWKQYTYTFALPSDVTGTSTGEIRLNIGFTGEGELNIDRVYLGLEKTAASVIPDAFSSAVIDASPDLIRLENVAIGQSGIDSKAWTLAGGNEGLDNIDKQVLPSGVRSLESSLKLVRDAAASPWFVIGSSASEEDVDNLLEYLCGSIKDPYGKMRVENGMAYPWSMLFSQMVVEISDADGVFSTDLQRSAYVNHMMEVIKSSPFYIDIKDKIVFLDGMNYEGGIMLSSADYHTSSLFVTNQSQDQGANLSSAEAIALSYSMYIDQIPRTPLHVQQVSDEWIRSASIAVSLNKTISDKEVNTELPVTAADCAAMLLSDIGNHSYAVMANLPVSRNPLYADTALQFSTAGDSPESILLSAVNNKTLLATASFLNDAVGGTSVQVLNAQEGLMTYAFNKEDTYYLVAANVTDKTIAFVLQADWSLNGDDLFRYASDGTLIQQTKLGQRGNRINLMPGQVIVARMPE